MKKFRKYRMVIHVIFNNKEILFKPDHPEVKNQTVWVSPHGNLVTEKIDHNNTETSAETIVNTLLGTKNAVSYIYEELHMKTVCIFSSTVFVNSVSNSECIHMFSDESFDRFGPLRLFPKTKKHSSGKHMLLLVNSDTKEKKYLSVESISEVFYDEYLKRENDNETS